MSFLNSYRSGLFEIFKSADGGMKFRAFGLIRSVYREGIRQFPQCLPSLLSLMSPCLSSSHEDLNEATWEFMGHLRSDFREFFFGSLWMSLKRNTLGRMGLIGFLKRTIRNNSDWMRTRRIDISAIRAHIEHDSQQDQSRDSFHESQPRADEDDSEGSTLFEESDHEQETNIESKLRIYLESFLKDVTSDEERDEEEAPVETPPEDIQMEKIAKRSAESEQHSDENGPQDDRDEAEGVVGGEPNSGAEDAIHVDLDNETEPLLASKDKEGEEPVKDREAEVKLGEEYYRQVKDKLMSNFRKQLSSGAGEVFAIETIIPDSRMAATAIVEALQSPNKFVQKAMLDLFFAELAPEYGLFPVDSAVRVTFRALLLLETHDYSIQRKLFKYFASPEVQKVLKQFDQVEYLANRALFRKLVSGQPETSRTRALIKLHFLTEGLRRVFQFDKKEPLVMRVLHVTRALIAESRKLIPIVFEFILGDMLRFLLDLQKWFFLNSNASAKKSKRFLIKFLRVLQPAIPNLLFSLSQKATFRDLPPLSLIYKMTELRETSLHTLTSNTGKPTSYERLLTNRFYRLPTATPEDTNHSFFQVVFVQLFLRGLHDHQILRAMRHDAHSETSAGERRVQAVVDLIKDEDSLRELFLCMELLDHLLGGFNAQSSLSVINLETIVFATRVIRVLKELLENASTFSQISFDAEEFVAKTVKCLALLELFVYSGTRVLMLSGINLQHILLSDPGYKELMGYVEGHKSALINPFSQSILDFRQESDSSQNIGNSQFFLSNLDVTRLIGSQSKAKPDPVEVSSPPKPQRAQSAAKSEADSYKLKASREISVQDEDLADRLRNIDSNLVIANVEDIQFEGLFDSKEISPGEGTFKESMFEFVNFFISKHQNEQPKNSVLGQLAQSETATDNRDRTPPLTEEKTQTQKDSSSRPANPFAKNKKKQEQVIDISYSKSKAKG